MEPLNRTVSFMRTFSDILEELQVPFHFYLCPRSSLGICTIATFTMLFSEPRFGYMRLEDHA
jgi:hypothetical protein